MALGAEGRQVGREFPRRGPRSQAPLPGSFARAPEAAWESGTVPAGRLVRGSSAALPHALRGVPHPRGNPYRSATGWRDEACLFGKSRPRHRLTAAEGLLLFPELSQAPPSIWRHSRESTPSSFRPPTVRAGNHSGPRALGHPLGFRPGRGGERRRPGQHVAVLVHRGGGWGSGVPLPLHPDDRPHRDSPHALRAHGGPPYPPLPSGRFARWAGTPGCPWGRSSC